MLAGVSLSSTTAADRISFSLMVPGRISLPVAPEKRVVASPRTAAMKRMNFMMKVMMMFDRRM